MMPPRRKTIISLVFKMVDVASLFDIAVSFIGNYISNRSYSLFCFCNVFISCFLSKKIKLVQSWWHIIPRIRLHKMSKRF